MAKDFDNEVPGDEGSEAQASGPESQGDASATAESGAEDGLTVEDILDATQTDEAAVADASDEDRDLLLDLKRLQAEYANYRRRTEGQREIEVERAKASVAKGLLPVLDDLDRADKHGDLIEGSALAVMADKLRAVVAKLGVETYGVAGDPFDPQQHEAIFQAPTPGVETATILEVVELGYRLGTIELRPAKVVVAVPVDSPVDPSAG